MRLNFLKLLDLTNHSVLAFWNAIFRRVSTRKYKAATANIKVGLFVHVVF